MAGCAERPEPRQSERGRRWFGVGMAGRREVEQWGASEGDELFGLV